MPHGEGEDGQKRQQVGKDLRPSLRPRRLQTRPTGLLAYARRRHRPQHGRCHLCGSSDAPGIRQSAPCEDALIFIGGVKEKV